MSVFLDDTQPEESFEFVYSVIYVHMNSLWVQG